MSSLRKIQSARANGARSQGPVTPEGKQRSSQNGIRHGILANTVVLEGESKERFEELLRSLTAELQPRSTAETALVETMAVARWRLLRIWSLQKTAFDIEMARENMPASRPQRAAVVFRKLADNSRSLDLLLRYENSFDRQFSRALSLLMKLRAASAPPDQDPAPEVVVESAPEPHVDSASHPAPTAPRLIFPREPNPGIEHPVTARPSAIPHRDGISNPPNQSGYAAQAANPAKRVCNSVSLHIDKKLDELLYLGARLPTAA